MRIGSSEFITFSISMMSFDTLLFKDLNLHTWQSNFGNKTWSITTNETDLIQKAEDLGIILLVHGSIIHREPAFASSKLRRFKCTFV